MTTEAARRAADALNKRREAEGLKRVTVWLSKEARFKLDALKKAAGSKDKAADAAILAWNGPGLGERVAKAMATAKPARPGPKVHVEAPLYERKAFNPRPKAGKK